MRGSIGENKMNGSNPVIGMTGDLKESDPPDDIIISYINSPMTYIAYPHRQRDQMGCRSGCNFKLSND